MGRIGKDWEEGFSKLLTFKEVKVTVEFRINLLNRILVLASGLAFKEEPKTAMPPERKQRLDDMGFVWDPYAEQWEEGFSKLLQFKEAEGHCRVPQSFKLDGFNLGSWVRSQGTFQR